MIAALGMLLLTVQEPPDVAGTWEDLQWHFSSRDSKLILRRAGSRIEGYWGSQEIGGVVDAQGRLPMKFQAVFDNFTPKIPPPPVQAILQKEFPGPHRPGRLALPMDLTLADTGALKGTSLFLSVRWNTNEEYQSRKERIDPRLFVPPAPPAESWAMNFGGTWSFTFLDGEARTLELTQTGSALKGLIRASGSRTYELEGNLYADGVLKMVLYLPGNEIGPEAPATIRETLAIHGDPKRPGFLRTSTWLRYHASTRKLRGYYAVVKVPRDPITNKVEPQEEFQLWELTSSNRLDPAFISPGLADGFSIPDDLREGR